MDLFGIGVMFCELIRFEYFCILCVLVSVVVEKTGGVRFICFLS